MFDIEAELKKLPTVPGVYMHKDSLGEVIYVGKAVNLRNRVRSYFRETSARDPKVRAMVDNIAEFDYIKCATEMEALILECNLIKKYMPKYNILLKDDKSYPYIEITISEEYPRVIRTRRMERDGNRYYGPYSDAGAVNRIIEMIGDMYPLKRCRMTHFPENAKPCLNYFIGKCGGICTGEADREEYRYMIEDVRDILEGRDANVRKRLQDKMEQASEELRYEEAAKYRDYIEALKTLGETQRAASVKDRDVDILIPINEGGKKIVARYVVRDGRMIGRDVMYMDDRGGIDGDDIIPAFIKQYYTMSSRLPREILMTSEPEDADLLTELLNDINCQNAEAGNDVMHKTRLIVPERGEKRSIVEMAAADTIELARTISERAERDADRKNALRDRMSSLIIEASESDDITPAVIEEGDEREYRVEAYDISNTNGLDTVAAMVVYEGRTAVKSDYRKFKIKSATGGDDYGSLQEVMYRRMKRAKNGDEGFNIYPDIIFVDGGLGQVHAVKTVVEAFRIPIPVVGLAKDDAHRTRAVVFSDGHEIVLKDEKLLFSYCGMIQEEVHRFAITFHRGTRGNRMIRSTLEDIPGVGPTRRKELLNHFREIDAIKHASYDELMEVPGMTSKVAENVIDFFGSDSVGERH